MHTRSYNRSCHSRKKLPSAASVLYKINPQNQRIMSLGNIPKLISVLPEYLQSTVKSILENWIFQHRKFEIPAASFAQIYNSRDDVSRRNINNICKSLNASCDDLVQTTPTSPSLDRSYVSSQPNAIVESEPVKNAEKLISKSRNSTPSRQTKSTLFLEQHHYLTRFVNKRHIFQEKHSKENLKSRKSSIGNQGNKSRSSTPIDRQTTVDISLNPDFSRFYKNTNQLIKNRISFGNEKYK